MELMKKHREKLLKATQEINGDGGLAGRPFSDAPIGRTIEEEEAEEAAAAAAAAENGATTPKPTAFFSFGGGARPKWLSRLGGVKASREQDSASQSSNSAAAVEGSVDTAARRASLSLFKSHVSKMIQVVPEISSLTEAKHRKQVHYDQKNHPHRGQRLIEANRRNAKKMRKMRKRRIKLAAEEENAFFVEYSIVLPKDDNDREGHLQEFLDEKMRDANEVCVNAQRDRDLLLLEEAEAEEKGEEEEAEEDYSNPVVLPETVTGDDREGDFIRSVVDRRRGDLEASWAGAEPMALPYKAPPTVETAQAVARRRRQPSITPVMLPQPAMVQQLQQPRTAVRADPRQLGPIIPTLDGLRLDLSVVHTTKERFMEDRHGATLAPSLKWRCPCGVTVETSNRTNHLHKCVLFADAWADAHLRLITDLGAPQVRRSVARVAMHRLCNEREAFCALAANGGDESECLDQLAVRAYREEMHLATTIYDSSDLLLPKQRRQFLNNTKVKELPEQPPRPTFTPEFTEEEQEEEEQEEETAPPEEQQRRKIVTSMDSERTFTDGKQDANDDDHAESSSRG